MSKAIWGVLRARHRYPQALLCLGPVPKEHFSSSARWPLSLQLLCHQRLCRHIHGAMHLLVSWSRPAEGWCNGSALKPHPLWCHHATREIAGLLSFRLWEVVVQVRALLVLSKLFLFVQQAGCKLLCPSSIAEMGRFGISESRKCPYISNLGSDCVFVPSSACVRSLVMGMGWASYESEFVAVFQRYTSRRCWFPFFPPV